MPQVAANGLNRNCSQIWPAKFVRIQSEVLFKAHRCFRKEIVSIQAQPQVAPGTGFLWIGFNTVSQAGWSCGNILFNSIKAIFGFGITGSEEQKSITVAIVGIIIFLLSDILTASFYKCKMMIGFKICKFFYPTSWPINKCFAYCANLPKADKYSEIIAALITIAWHGLTNHVGFIGSNYNPGSHGYPI